MLGGKKKKRSSVERQLCGKKNERLNPFGSSPEKKKEGSFTIFGGVREGEWREVRQKRSKSGHTNGREGGASIL